MRRITFYIVVALLAFGIGSLFAVCFCQDHSLKLAVKEMPSESKIIKQNINDKMPEAKFSCEDEATKAVWTKLAKNKDFIEDAYSVIEARQIKNCQELFDRYSINLNNDDSNEIVLKGGYILFCNSGGDCATWIVSKMDNEYQIIFEAAAGESIEAIQILKEKSHNFQNIKTKLYNGWSEDNIGFFEFDTNEYKIKRCFEDANSGYEIAPFVDEIRDGKLVPAKLEKCVNIQKFIAGKPKKPESLQNLSPHDMM